jgi:hypothetical protein
MKQKTNLLGNQEPRKSRIIDDPAEIERINKMYENEEVPEVEKPEVEAQEAYDTSNDTPDLIYVPETDLYFTKEKLHLGLDWNQTHKELSKQGLRMPLIPEFESFIDYLKNSKNLEHLKIYNEITEKRSPWRGCHLDAYFEQRKDGLYILTHNKSKAEKLETCLMEDCYVKLEFNSQGLPIQKSQNQEYVQGKNIHFWFPRDRCVARFSAESGWAYIYCIGGSSGGDPSLGVYAVSQTGGKTR